MAEKLLLVARVAGAFGVKGEVRITSFTADPLSLPEYGTLLDRDGRPRITLVSARAVKGGLVGRASEIRTREEAEALRGLQLFIPRDRLPPAGEDEFYLADLIGLRAETPEGDLLGTVKSVQDFGAGDLLEIAPAGGGATWWLAFTRDAVPEVRLSEGRLLAVPPPTTE